MRRLTATHFMSVILPNPTGTPQASPVENEKAAGSFRSCSLFSLVIKLNYFKILRSISTYSFGCAWAYPSSRISTICF